MVHRVKKMSKRSAHKGRGKGRRKSYRGRGKFVNWLKSAGRKVGSFLKAQLPGLIQKARQGKLISRGLNQLSSPYAKMGSQVAGILGFGKKKRLYHRKRHGGAFRLSGGSARYGQGFRV